MKFTIPYGSTKLNLDLPDEQVAGVLTSHIGDLKAEGSEDSIVRAAMADVGVRTQAAQTASKISAGASMPISQACSASAHPSGWSSPARSSSRDVTTMDGRTVGLGNAWFRGATPRVTCR